MGRTCKIFLNNQTYAKMREVLMMLIETNFTKYKGETEKKHGKLLAKKQDISFA